MDDTRDTMVCNLKNVKKILADNELGEDVHPDDRPKPRFKKGDVLIAAYRPEIKYELQDEPRWDREFQGWLIAPSFIGIHECNYILAEERELWKPHKNGFWSYWTKK